MSADADAQAGSLHRYRFGTAEFDESAFELRVAGLRVDIERRALQVLALLLRHAGEVVTKDDLFDQVWTGLVTVDKVLPNAIAKLRRALGEDNAELLATVPRVGYRLNGVFERTAQKPALGSALALAVGDPVPRRENFILRRQLGGRRDGEVWLAEQLRTRGLRVYKFAGGPARLADLKREATLSRVLQESLDDPAPVVRLIDWNFESPPYFLECEYGGEDLLVWSAQHLDALGRDERIELFLQVADAVAAAHAVGVLHKDLKPANILVEVNEEGARRIRLTDFGSGGLLDPDRLRDLGITRFGLSTVQGLAPATSSGTLLYIAPEVFSGQVPTVRSDVFALGVVLYQLLVGDMNRPMASGWEHDIGDDLLCEDIALATRGDPAHRLASAADLSMRLRAVSARRRERERLADAARQAEHDRVALARSRARRPYLVALVTALVAGLGVILGLYSTARHARQAAERELATAQAINRFLNEDLIGASNPLISTKGRNASLEELLLAARERIDGRFAAQPHVQASIRASLAALLNTIERLPEAEAEARQALVLYEGEGGADSVEALRARAMLVRLLTRVAKFDEAQAQLAELDRRVGDSADPVRRYLRLSAWGIYHMNRGAYAAALPMYQEAIPLSRQIDPDAFTVRDSMRMDLINALTLTGDASGAEAEGQALIAEIKARPQDNGLVLAFARAAVAKALIAQGDYDVAQADLLAAQETIVDLLGADHTRHIMVLSDLFDIAVHRRDWPVALDHAEQVYRGLGARLGEAHNVSNIALFNWGQVFYESGRFEPARERIAPAHAQLTALLGEDNPVSQMVALWFALVEVELGHIEAASRLLRPLSAQVLETSAADGLWQHRLDLARGRVLFARGEVDQAAPLLRSGLLGLEAADAKGVMVDGARRDLEAIGARQAGAR